MHENIFNHSHQRKSARAPPPEPRALPVSQRALFGLRVFRLPRGDLLAEHLRLLLKVGGLLVGGLERRSLDEVRGAFDQSGDLKKDGEKGDMGVRVSSSITTLRTWLGLKADCCYCFP